MWIVYFLSPFFWKDRLLSSKIFISPWIVYFLKDRLLLEDRLLSALRSSTLRIVYFRWIVYFQAKDRLLSGKRSSTFIQKIVYFHPGSSTFIQDRLLSVGPMSLTLNNFIFRPFSVNSWNGLKEYSETLEPDVISKFLL